jgi:hypothetical protein
MAEVPVYVAKVTVGDSAKKFSTVSLRVDATDAKAWFAAADTAARAATKVGLLQAAVFNLMLSSQQYSFAVEGEMVNDAHVFPSLESNAFNSNKLNVSIRTTNAGLPRDLTFTIPQREPTSFEMESDGVTVVLDDADEVADLVTQIIDTMLSSYATAVTAVNKITLNDD